MFEPLSGNINDFDFDYNLCLNDALCGSEFKYTFDVPPTPPASCLPSPKNSPRVSMNEASEGVVEEESGNFSNIFFDWSQAVTLEDLEDGSECSTKFDEGVCMITPPRSPTSPTLKEEPVANLALQSLLALEIKSFLDDPETEIAHIDPSIIQASSYNNVSFSTPSVTGPSTPESVSTIPEEEDLEIDVETVDEHPLSGAQLLCLNQQLLLQQPAQSFTPPPPVSFLPAPRLELDVDFSMPSTASSYTFPTTTTTAPAEVFNTQSDLFGAPADIFGETSNYSYTPASEEISNASRHRYAPYSKPSGIKDPDHKRHTHNLLERRRREDLKTTFDLLSAVVPEVANDSRCSKLQILQGATDQLLKLTEVGHHFTAVRDNLRTEQNMLMERLCQLRGNLQAHGKTPCV